MFLVVLCSFPLLAFAKTEEIVVPVGEGSTSRVFQITWPNTEQQASVTITSPEQLSGMCFEWSGENSGISYQGLSCRTEQPFLPKTSFAAIIVNVLQAASVPENLTDQGPRDGMSCFTGQSESGPFTILVNSSNGYIQEILLEELDFRAVFSGQTA